MLERSEYSAIFQKHPTVLGTYSKFKSKYSVRLAFTNSDSASQSLDILFHVNFKEPLPIYKEMKSKLEPSTSKQRTKPSSSSTDCDDDLISRYTSDTLATMLTNRSSVSQPHQLTTGATLASMSQQGNNDNNSNNKLAFIEKYTDEELPDSDLIDSNEASKFLVDETRL